MVSDQTLALMEVRIIINGLSNKSLPFSARRIDIKKMNILSLLFLIISFNASFGKTIHVSGDSLTIQAGIDSAANSDTVLIGDGTYKGIGNKNLDFKGKAIVVMSENGYESSVVDCENSGRGFYFHSGEDSLSILKGLKIIHGFIEGSYPDNSCIRL
jgi:hypothetical protein